MKKIIYILLAIAAFLASAHFVSAQDIPFPADNKITFDPSEWNKTYEIDTESGVATRKIISKPNSKGVYHILLDAFVTGREIKTQKSLPADIVLVLDVSGSMNDDMDGTDHEWNEPEDNRRLTAMKTAVKAFIDIINQDDINNAPAGRDRLGNRIAIVPFNGSVSNSGNNQVRNWRGMGQASAMKTNVDNLQATGGTLSNLGMERALTLLENSSSQLKTVVFFTDGNPGYQGNWVDHTWSYQHSGYYYDDNTWSTANATINAANAIKNLAVPSENPDVRVISNIFTVSIITEEATSDYTRVYLEKVSSNYLGAEHMGSKSTWVTTDIYSNGNGSRNTAETDFSLTATTSDGLKKVFETIASSSGGSSETLGEASVSTVDVVSASFMLPTGSDVNSIRVYTAPCESVQNSGQPIFGTYILAPNRDEMYQPMKKVNGVLVEDGPEKDVDNAITKGLVGNKITVEGFDFSNLWCGEVVENGQHKGWHGYKVSILIPIKMNPEAFGGVGVETNGEGSGIFINDINEFPFTSPKVNLPVNIVIKKEGLDVGESSKFTILRSDDNKQTWEEVTSVFVTRHKGQGKNDARTRIEGLPATNRSGVEYIYKVREDDWSWSYTLQGNKELTSDDNDNPFTFTNEKKQFIDSKIRHAESKATNTFTTGKGEAYDDSKDNGRAVITITTTSGNEGGNEGGESSEGGR